MIIMNIFVINIYLGFVCFFIGTIVFVKMQKKCIHTIVFILLIIIQLFFSIALSLFFWRFWFFPFDIMLGPFSLPAAIAEISTLLIAKVVLRTGDCINGYERISTYAVNFQANLQNAGILKKTTSSRDLEGSEGNAYRHVLWQAMLTSEFNEEIAAQIGNAHEDNAKVSLDQRVFKNISEADQTIDLLNNKIGRSIGKRNTGNSKNSLAKEVLKEFKNSGFYVAEKMKDGNYYVRKRCISEEKYNEGVKLIDKKGI